jgi:hypothetical protein
MMMDADDTAIILPCFSAALYSLLRHETRADTCRLSRATIFATVIGIDIFRLFLLQPSFIFFPSFVT